MDVISPFIILVLIILIFTIVIFKKPCAEFFQGTVDILMEKSSILYSNKDDEKSYLESLNPINNDLLIMNRCIEFKKEGMEKVIDIMRSQNRFFISQKYKIRYTDFNTVEETIKENILKLYDNSSKERSFYGPIYLLITQYPVYTNTTLDMDGCVVSTIDAPIDNIFKPIVQTVSDGCETPQTLIECEYYILMPSHKPFNGGVGEYAYKTWNEIKNNMEMLLMGKNNNILNPRSKNQQCYIKCGNIQTDGYVCGARNSVNDKPYKSVVFNTPKNNKEERIHVDYANLYIINTNGINLLLGKTISPIIETGVKIEAVELPVVNVRETAFGTDLSHINDNETDNLYGIDRAEYEKTQRELQIERERYEAQRKLEEMTDEQAQCYLMRYNDLRNAFGSDIGRAKTHWVENGIRENRTKECNDMLLQIINGATNGLTRERVAPSAKHIRDTYNTTRDGLYWIDLPVVGPTQVYCIMNPQCAGGGWMLAMKGVRGNTFHYDSNHWKTASTLNKVNPSRSEQNAKYDVFNHYKAIDWFAGFPDIPQHTGDISRSAYSGFTWVEHNAVGGRKTLLEVFSSNQRITKTRNPRALTKFNPSVWSSQNGFQFYGMNYQGGHGHKTRWGFGWNNESDERTNDVSGGIGTTWASAGDHYGCCGNRASNRSMRFELYVR
jgi:hypothetical protein